MIRCWKLWRLHSSSLVPSWTSCRTKGKLYSHDSTHSYFNQSRSEEVWHYNCIRIFLIRGLLQILASCYFQWAASEINASFKYRPLPRTNCYYLVGVDKNALTCGCKPRYRIILTREINFCVDLVILIDSHFGWRDYKLFSSVFLDLSCSLLQCHILTKSNACIILIYPSSLLTVKQRSPSNRGFLIQLLLQKGVEINKGPSLHSLKYSIAHMLKPTLL